MNNHLSDSAIDAIIKHGSDEHILELVKTHELRSKHLRRLFHRNKPDAHMEALRNPHHRDKVDFAGLANMVQHDNPEVHMEALTNSFHKNKLLSYCLWKMSCCDNPKVHMEMLRNHKDILDSDSLRRIFNHNNPEVNKMIKKLKLK